MIALDAVVKGFGRIVAVNRLSFELRDGSITGLIGSNGAGKTTTLRMIAGALVPDAGRVLVDDVDPRSGAAGAQRRLGALLDHRGLYARLSARENLEYFARLRHMTAACAGDRVCGLLDLLGLTATADRHVAGFSQGERMKVALGRALVHDPANLLLDEPTNGLDVPTVRSLRDVLRSLRDEGACILFSSHVLGEVEQLCDRVLVVSKGTLVADGTVQEVRTQAGGRDLEEAFMSVTRRGKEMAC